MSTRAQANELAKALSDFTIESLEKDEQNFGWSNSKNSLLDFPNEVLVNIFSFVGNPKFNKYPEENFHQYLSSRDSNDFERKQNFGANSPKSQWIQKTNREFAMKNLMSLRRVCTVFEDIINNGMMPGLDYEPIEVDLKFKATESLNAVQMFKYGGTGAIYPCTLLRRISKFNDGDDFEHLQKFEKIRNLLFVGIPLTRDLFQMILRMDLKSAKKVEFLSIPDVQLGEDVNIVEYIQTVLDTVDSQAKFFFNSEVFNPDSVLFGQEAAAPAPRQALFHGGFDDVAFPVLNLPHRDFIEEIFEEHEDVDDINLELQAHFQAEFGALVAQMDQPVPEEERRRREEEREIRREINIVEQNNDRKYHKMMRNNRRPSGDVRDFRRHRAINIIHNILLSEPHIPHKDYEYRLKDGYNHWKKELMKTFKKKIEKQSKKMKEIGEWHFHKIFVLMENQPIKKRELMFHLKVLKKITKEGAILTEDEQSMITSRASDMKHRNHLMTKFAFINKLHGRTRLYTVHRH